MVRVAKFAAGVIETGSQLATGFNDTVDATFTCEYLREFSQNFEMTPKLFLGAWGKMIHEKKKINLLRLFL